MNRILDALIQNSSNCVEKMAKREEWKKMKERLNDSGIKDELNEMDVIEL